MSQPFAGLFWTMLVMYAVTVAAQIYAQTFDKRAMMQRAWYGVAGAFVIHTLLVAWRWIETGHIPTIGNFENALAGAWFIVFMVIWAGWKERHPLLAAGALPFALVILGGGAMSDATARPMSASLRSFWLYIHIFFAWLAYGGYTVACGAGIAWLTKSRRAGAASSAVRDDLARLEELMFRSTVFGFITDAVMIAAGSIWAKDLWGAYWSWDPVETWSLLSWLIYGLALHLRITMGWRGRKLAWLLVFAIVGVLISFWGVNLVMEGSAHVFNVG